MHFTAYVYTLYVPACVLIRQKYLFTLRILKHTCNTIVLFLVPISLLWFLCPCFSVFSSLWCCKSASINLGPKKRIFWKFHWFVFKRLSWTCTSVSTFYLEMALFNHFSPTLTHSRLPERKLKKCINPLLLNTPCY